jgi:hypothetical protein
MAILSPTGESPRSVTEWDTAGWIGVDSPTKRTEPKAEYNANLVVR